MIGIQVNDQKLCKLYSQKLFLVDGVLLLGTPTGKKVQFW